MITEEEKLLVLIKWGEFILPNEIDDFVNTYEIHDPNTTFIKFVDLIMNTDLEWE